MDASTSQPPGPFSSREFNGEWLLEELRALRAEQVSDAELAECVGLLRPSLTGAADACAAQLRVLAAERRDAQAALASWLERWADRLTVDAEVPMLLAHLQQLALTALLEGALQRASERWGPREER